MSVVCSQPQLVDMNNNMGKYNKQTQLQRKREGEGDEEVVRTVQRSPQLDRL